MLMSVPLEQAMKRFESALGLLEASVLRRLEGERRRGDLETELQIMQDDRARLAMELDGTIARLDRVEAAAEDVGERVERAIGAIRDVLHRGAGEAPSS
jgi:predicted  nucleic acid-binding Zn-ribbon protein